MCPVGYLLGSPPSPTDPHFRMCVVAAGSVASTRGGGAVSSKSVVPRAGLGRKHAVSCEAKKVALLGAGGGIGQPLSLLLKVQCFPV